MARAVWASWARASVGEGFRCFESASAVRPEWVATTRSATFRRREIMLAASTTLSVIGRTRPARETDALPFDPYQRPAATVGEGARDEWCDPSPPSANSSDSASAAIWLMMETASTGYWPIAVSPESITASVPSRTALKTSLASRAGRPAGSLHAIEHLSRRDDRHPRGVAGRDDALLHRRDPCHVQLDAQVSPSDHHRVGFGDDRVQVRQRLALLDLGDDPPAAPAFQLAAQLDDVLRTTDEREPDIGDLVGRRPFQVRQVFVRESRDTQDTPGHIDPLVGPDKSRERHLEPGPPGS